MIGAIRLYRMALDTRGGKGKSIGYGHVVLFYPHICIVHHLRIRSQRWLGAETWQLWAQRVNPNLDFLIPTGKTDGNINVKHQNGSKIVVY